MPFHGQPAPDLARVVRAPSAAVIPAVPLEPAARVIVMDPSLVSPVGQRLRGVHTEVIQFRIMPIGAQACTGKPALGKLITTVGHVLAAEDTEAQHLPGCQLRPEVRMKISAGRCRQVVAVIRLHQVVHDDVFVFHVNH